MQIRRNSLQEEDSRLHTDGNHLTKTVTKAKAEDSLRIELTHSPKIMSSAWRGSGKMSFSRYLLANLEWLLQKDYTLCQTQVPSQRSLYFNSAMVLQSCLFTVLRTKALQSRRWIRMMFLYRGCCYCNISQQGTWKCWWESAMYIWRGAWLATDCGH